ncbi:MAG: hypothetical protein LBE13_05670 [Bacteroidales bacterium]|jgi:hypothetical protein|nr:hypothetical protein [Bacteroidales bacterium]
MKIINRIYVYIEFKGIKPTRFEKDLGISNGYLGTQLKRNADLGETILNKIIDYCLDLSPEWLLTGKGEMLKNPEENGNQSIVGNNNIQGNITGDNKIRQIYKSGDSLEAMRALLQEKDERIKEKDNQIKEKDNQINKLLSILHNIKLET